MKQLLYFSTKHCGPCKMFTPVMLKAAETIPVNFVDASASELTTKYSVTSVPTVVLVENDTEKARFIGMQFLHQVLEFYNQNK